MLNKDGVSVWEDEKVLETDGGDGRTTARMDFMPPNCTLKNGQDGQFSVMCISLQ